jgi:hypothetical protein
VSFPGEDLARGVILPEYRSLGAIEYAWGQGSLVSGYTTDADLDIALLWSAAELLSRHRLNVDRHHDRGSCDAPALAADCTPARAISVIAIQGTQDLTVPMGGGKTAGGNTVFSASDSVALWGRLNRCSGSTSATANVPVSPSVGTSVTVLTDSGCAAATEVELYTIEGMGHVWPGTPAAPGSTHDAVQRQRPGVDVLEPTPVGRPPLLDAGVKKRGVAAFTC